MTNFTGAKFTHQQTEDYGEGKKVTSTLLMNDAENTEYLYNMIQKQGGTNNKYHIYAYPPEFEETNGIELKTTTEETNIDNYIIPPSSFYVMQKNETTGYAITKPYTREALTHWQTIENKTLSTDYYSTITKTLISPQTYTKQFKIVPFTREKLVGTSKSKLNYLDAYADDTLHDHIAYSKTYEEDGEIKTYSMSIDKIEENIEKMYGNGFYQYWAEQGVLFTNQLDVPSAYQLEKGYKSTIPLFHDENGALVATANVGDKKLKIDPGQDNIQWNDKTIQTSYIRFKEDPVAGGLISETEESILTVTYYYRYWSNAPDLIDFTTHSETFTTGNNTTSVELSNTPVQETVTVYLNNTELKYGLEYTVTDNTVKLNSLPLTSSHILITYKKQYNKVDYKEFNRFRVRYDLNRQKIDTELYILYGLMTYDTN